MDSKKVVRLIELFSEGKTVKEAAVVLGMNERTLERKVADLIHFHKARNKTHLVALCLRRHIIE